MLATDCQTNIACFDLIISINEPDWEFASYNIWTEYPAPPVMSYSSDNACLTQNGGDTDNNPAGQYRVSGINGITHLQPNVPTVFHSICYSYPDENTIQDSVIASGGTLNLYGFPFYSTITLVKHSLGNTVGITIPVQKFLTLNGSTFSCIISELTIDKVLTSNADNDGSGTISLGDVLTYTVTATNPGNITQHNVVVNDPKLSPSTQSCTALEYNETCVLVGTYTVTQADVDAGEIINTASVVSNEEGPFTIELTTPVPQEPELTVIKTLVTDVSGGISVGDVLSYSVVATNTGNLTLHNVVVSDPKLTPNSKTCATLAPGASCTLSGIHMVTQTEMNSGQIVNTGIADADETSPVTDQVITPLPQFPEITTEKTLLSDISGGVVVGDVLFYMVEVTNTGNVTLNNVVVSDQKLAPKTKTCPSVSPTSTCSLIGYYIVKQSDIDAGFIINTGIGDSDETDPEPDEITTPIPQYPDLSIEKTLLTDVTGGVVVGDVLTYSIVVTNTGNVTLHNVTITDPILTPNSAGCVTLAPAATCTLSGTHTVSQGDVDAGQVLNTATADADETTPETDQVNVPITQNPALSTVKTLLTDISGGVEEGDVFSYSVVVTNTGNVTLHNVTVSDPKLTPNSTNCATLAPNASCTLTGTYTVTLADMNAGQIVNTGTGDSDETGPDPDQITTPLVKEPALTTVKTLLTDISGGVEAGDVFTYSVVVTNTGNVTLHNVIVTDPKLTPNSSNCATLAPNAACTLTGTYTVTLADMDAGQIVNTGTGDSDETDPDPDQITTPLTQEPEITTVKTLITDISGGVKAGDVFTYSVVVTNTGNVTLHNVTVGDPKLTPNTTSCATLIPNQACTLTGTYTVTLADMDAGQIVNTGTGDSDETDPEPDQITTPLVKEPALTTVKTLITDISGGVEAGDVFTYSVVVTNTGNITLNNVTVSDPKLTPNSSSCATLAPNASCTLTGTYTVTLADMDAGQIINTGTGDSDETDPEPDQITTPLVKEPSITTVKTLLTDISGGVKAGDVFTYSVVVTNTGNVTLHNVTVSDPKLTPNSSNCATLAPNASCTLTGTYTVTLADMDAGQIINTGTGDSDETDPEPDQVITPLVKEPALTTVKTLLTDISGGVEAADVFTYSVVVTNTGNITLHNVTVSDPKLTPNSSNCATLAPNASCTLTGTYIVTLADMLAGQITNTGTGDSDETGPEPDQVITPLIQEPEITTVKTLLTDISGGVEAGDVFTYSVVVTNTGNVTLHNVTVNDPKLTPNATSCATLDPSSSCTLTGIYMVTQANLNAGQVVNTGVGDSDETGPVSDELITPLVQEPEITTVKTLLTDVSNGISVGDVLVYRVQVTNTGNITLHNVTVNDPKITPNSKTCPTVNPDATCTLTGYYIVKQTDIDAGQIINTGTGDSDETGPDPDQITTPITQEPEITTVKTLLTDISGGVKAGDVFTYSVVVTNTGNVTLHNVTVSDPKLTPNSSNCATLAPNASCTLTGTYTVTLADMDAGQIVNTGTGDSDETGPDPDQITTPLVKEPSLTTVKTLLTDISGGVEAGDVFTYSVVVTNTGNVTLHNVTVSDPKLTPNTTSCATLAPNQACTLTGTYTVMLADMDAGQIVNTGTGDSDETGPEPDQITTPLTPEPEITTVKTLLTDISGGVEAGDVFTYSVVVTNTGNITLHNVTVSDPKLTPSFSNCATLAPNASCTLTGTYTIKLADMDAGQIINTGTGVSDETDPEPDQVITPLIAEPEITTVKTLLTNISGGVSPGDVFTYTVVVTNTGNVTLHNVTVSDPKLTPNSSDCATLAPNASCTLTGTYTVTLADMNAGQIINTGTGDSDETGPETDQVITPISPIPIDAIDDDATSSPVNGYYGGTAVQNVLDNDLLNSVSVIPAEVTISAISDPADGVTLNTTTGEVSVDAGTPAGTYYITYKICEVLNPTNCDQATVTVEVTSASILAHDDDASASPVNGYEGGTAVFNVLDNDELNHDPVIPAEVTINTVLDPLDGVTLNTTTGEVTVDAGTPAGTYYITYEICENLNLSNCDQALITVEVSAASIVAVDDDASATPVNGYIGGTAVANVLNNDELNGNPVNPAEVTISAVLDPLDGVTLNTTTGEVTVDAGTPAGTYYITYEICEILNASNCDQALITVEVSAASIVAVDDDASASPVNGYNGGTAVSNVLDNDELNSNPVNPAEVTISAVLDPLDGVTLNTGTGEVTVDAGTPAGTYYIIYEICEILNPANCDQAEVTVEVTAAPIVAVDDDASASPVNGYDGGTAVNNVLDNDLLNGNPVIPAEVTISAVLDPLDGVTLNTTTGEVTVDPQTPAGTYTIVYQICEVLNPTNCDQALITVEVSAASIVAVDDDASATPVNGYEGGTAVSNVLDNDELNGDPVNPAEVTITAVLDPLDGVTLNTTTGEVTVDAGTPAGTYYITYEICEILNPTNCDQAEITVIVDKAPIVANDDDATGSPVNGYYGGTAVSNVLDNDLLNGVSVIPSEVIISAISDPADGVTLNTTTGEVTVSAGTPAGTYYITYEICEVLNPTNCDEATITVEVTFANIFANDDDATGTPVNGYDGGTAVSNVLDNDLLNGNPVIPAEVTLSAISDPADGVTLNTTTGEVTVDAGTPAGTYYISYEICENLNLTNCDQALITVEVSQAVIVATDDLGGPVNGIIGGTAVSSVLDNDLLNGDQVVPAEITLTAVLDPADGVTLNIATGEVTVDPGTLPGTYYITYEICEILNPANCDQAEVTVLVNLNTAPVTVNEVVAICESASYSGNVLSNGDYDPDGTTLFISTVALDGPSHGNIDLLADGSFEYTPLTGYYGPDQVIVSVCDNGIPLPSVCTNDTIFITVQQDVVVDLGADHAICENDTPQLQAFLESYSSLLWTTTGDGTFTDATGINPTFTPGSNDIANGTVEICLTAGSLLPCVAPVTDCMNLIINYLPEVSLGNSASICSSDIYETSPVLSNTSGLFWVSSGDGYFDDEAAAITVYYPGTDDIATGSVELCLYASGINPCFIQVNDCLNLEISPAPEANAGNDVSICFNETHQLNGAASNAGVVLWTTSGDGTFSSTSSLTPVYTPGVIDASSGFANLCLEATGEFGCSLEQDTDCMTLSLINAPAITGLDEERTLACEDYDFDVKKFYPVQLDLNVSDYSTIEWTTTGDGYFDDPTVVNATYNLGLHDIWDGGVTLCLDAYGLGNCQFVTSACIDLIIPIQIIAVNNPGWNGISSYVDKSTTLLPEVMVPVVNELIIMLNKQGLEYWPEPDPPINQLGNWAPVGYKTKFNAATCLPIYGDTLKNQNFLVNGAFTYLPMLTNVPTRIVDLLGANALKVLLIYDWPTSQVWTNAAADFYYLQPGKAYLMVNKTPSSSFTVSYPNFDPQLPITSSISGPIGTHRNNSLWNDVTNTMQPHLILFAAEATAELQPGDIIGAFDEMENCVGMAEFESRETFFKIAVMGDDPMTAENYGCQQGDQLNYKLYRPATGEIFDIALTYNPEYPSSDGKFAVNSASLAENLVMNITSVIMLENEDQIKVFPNPATDMLNVVSDVEVKGVTLVNFIGQKVMSQAENSSRFQLNVSDFTPGIYFLKIETMSGNIITRRVSIY